MTHWQPTIGAIAGFLSILCFVPYIVTILQGKTKPNRATWWIWVILSAVISASYYSTGATNTIWLPVCGGIGQLMIAILSLKYGEGGWSRFDRLCLLGVGMSLLLWWQFNSPLIALLSNILIDFLGALPTIKKSYYEPQTENFLTWSLYLVASTINLFAIESWSVALWAFPLYIFLINTTIVIFLLRNKLLILRTAYWQRQLRKLSKINFM
ncbi:hypothetical protein IQ244_11055 [Nostoc sp. LEGE 06077]|uniref:hypothetical protein n=1 Tax=Nostoc sp. LEGE 06077 TaxID=915325 RepID=UPI00187F2B2E|nr:hypothetical protein [Nostoc sp. LEGE 06077]MBE9207049.1 hypothetical protein [Nostoc sp. LEGE 06077]